MSTRVTGPPERGLLLAIKADDARSLSRRPRELDYALAAHVDLRVNDAVIGVSDEKGPWQVVMTALIKRVPKRRGLPRLKHARYWRSSKDEPWELPLDYPRSESFSVEKNDYEFLDHKVDVQACLLGSSAITDGIDTQWPQARNRIPIGDNVVDNLMIVFEQGQPHVRTKRDVRRTLIKGPAAYSECMREWLIGLPKKKGSFFEDLLVRFFELHDQFGCVRNIQPTRDGGVDLTVNRLNPLGPEEVCIVQAKNTAESIGPAVVQQLRGACCAKPGARGILISVSGFSNNADDEAKAPGPGITLVDWSGLWPVLRTLFNEESMPDLYDEFRDLCPDQHQLW